MAGYKSRSEIISSNNSPPFIASGNTSITNLYSGFPNGVATSNNWENPSTLGYLENGTDIANKVQSYYIDYYSSVQDSYADQYPPAWCKKLKVIAISGGGGGGSGGANSGNTDAGSGGSGAGGNMAIMVSNNDLDPYFKYSVYFTQGGTGGAYQGTAGDSGNVGRQGTEANFTFINTDQNDYGSLTVYGGGGGGWGPGTDKNNNDSNGGQNYNVYNNNSYGGNSNGNDINAGVAGGNNSTVAYDVNFGGNYANNFNFTGNHGNPGAGGGNEWVGYSGVVANYNSNNDPPPLNSNIDYSSNGNKVQNNNTSISNVPIPPLGQGGVGGWNSNNGNGYEGQQGGPAKVRVYFMA